MDRPMYSRSTGMEGKASEDIKIHVSPEFKAEIMAGPWPMT